MAEVGEIAIGQRLKKVSRPKKLKPSERRIVREREKAKRQIQQSARFRTSYGGPEEIAAKTIPTNAPIESRQATNETQHVGQEDISWLKTVEFVPLDLITLSGDGTQCYFGSIIRGNVLEKTAKKLDRIALNELVYGKLRTLIRQDATKHLPLQKARTKDGRVFKLKSREGLRSYCMKFPTKNDKIVVIEVAVCDKQTQKRVLRAMN